MNQGRNEICMCGSGKKFKRCCINRPRIVDKLDIGTSEYLAECQQYFGKSFKPPMPTAEERRATAYHEAGHAIRFQAGGLDVKFCTAMPYFCEVKHLWSMGITALVNEQMACEKDILRHYLEGIMAGTVAPLFANPPLPPLTYTGGGGDDDQIERLCRNQLKISSRTSFAALLRAEGEPILKQFFALQNVWAAVEELVTLLMSENEVGGDKIRELVSRHKVAVPEYRKRGNNENQK